MSDIEKEIAESREFLRRLTKLGELGDEFDAACIAATAANKRWNAAREAYVRLYIETESKFPSKKMPFYAEAIWGPK